MKTLVEQLNQLKLAERHRTRDETRYWCEQYRNFAQHVLDNAFAPTHEHLERIAKAMHKAEATGFGWEDLTPKAQTILMTMARAAVLAIHTPKN